MNKFYVYMYLDLDNVPFYIGKGKDTRYRVSQHLDKNNTNHLFKNKIRKVGVDNIKTHFLHENISEEEAFRWERYWIKYIGRRDLKQGTLCNLTDGGEGESGRIVSDETKRKMSKALRGKPGYWEGKKHSKDHKKNISEALKGREMPEDVIQKIKGTMKGNPKLAYWKGREMSEETKRKMRKAHKGKKLSEKTKRKMKKPKSIAARRNMSVAQKKRRKHEKLNRNKEIS